MDETLAPFDPKSNCIKCGWSIPDPEIPTKAGPDGALMPTGPAPQPTPPTTFYCNGEGCDWAEEGDEMDEHMHQLCDVCNYEWLSAPLG